MDKRKISIVTSQFQVIKFTANFSVDSVQILGENIGVNESPIEIRVPDKLSQNLFYNSKWFKLHQWLEYDEVSDSVKCFVCKSHHSKLKGNVEILVFDDYQAASYHRLAMTYEAVVPQCGDVKEMQNEATATCQNENFML